MSEKPFLIPEIRTALIQDIMAMHEVRLSVLENRLSNPQLVLESDYSQRLAEQGRGWVALSTNRIVGFSIVDTLHHNLWALFVHPAYENQGYGKALHHILLNWYFSKKKQHPIWLTTSPRTRAESFYRKYGWQETGEIPNGELKFELTFSQWMKTKRSMPESFIVPPIGP